MSQVKVIGGFSICHQCHLPSSSRDFVLNVCITKGVAGLPCITLDLHEKEERELHGGKIKRWKVSVMPRRADPTSIRNEGIRGWDGFAECVVGDILLHVSGDSEAEIQAANQPGFHLQVSLNPPCKPRNYIKSSRWNGIF